MKLQCKYLASCQVCSLGAMDFELQKVFKQDRLTQALKSGLPTHVLESTQYDFIFPAFDTYRMRSDFIFQDGKLGWYNRDREFISIASCPLHTEPLTQLVQDVASLSLPIGKGSLRFRIGHDNIRGLWLDLANLDIKKLLETGDFLESLWQRQIIVEMGQKGKRVVRSENGFKLSEPEPAFWFNTVYGGQRVPLYSLISSFTQTNFDLNLQMIAVIQRFLENRKFEKIVEFGSGVGNFTLFLSELSKSLIVIENDGRNLTPLRKNIAFHRLEAKIKIYENINVFLRDESPSSKKEDSLYFVNPARSGVGALFDRPLAASSVLYVSCHLESFIADVAKLAEQGFVLDRVTLFDQFPHSEHFEIISFFVKSSQ